MKNISTHVAIAVVSLVLVVASAFLMTAADWEIRVLANYLTLGWALVFTVSATRALLLEGRREEKATHKTAHAAAYQEYHTKRSTSGCFFFCSLDGRGKIRYSIGSTACGTAYRKIRTEETSMKKIAVITGASSGMGRRFAETVDRYGRFDEVWVIARHQAQLEALKATVPFPIRVLALDLTDRTSFGTYAAALAEEPVQVGLLMNCSGYGKFSAVLDTPLAVNLNMTDLNCQAVVAMCQMTAPYMPSGSQIINIASVAAFQPIPYIGIYGATKAFVLSFSRALNRELRSRGIGVMAVCPFWTKTAFFDRAIREGEQPIVKKYVAMYDVEDIVTRTWRDAKRGKDVCKYGFIARAQAGLAKILPHSLVMDVWMKQQELR